MVDSEDIRTDLLKFNDPKNLGLSGLVFGISALSDIRMRITKIYEAGSPDYESVMKLISNKTNEYAIELDKREQRYLNGQ